jgi:hypothetical protein
MPLLAVKLGENKEKHRHMLPLLTKNERNSADKLTKWR